MKRLFKLDLTKKLYISNIIVVTAIVLLMGFLFMKDSNDIKRKDIDNTLLTVSNIVAKNSDVIYSLKNNVHLESLQKDLNAIAFSNNDIDVVVVCDKNSIRLYHNDADKVGKKLVGGDEGRVLSGTDSYLSTAEGTLGKQRRAFSAIYDENHELLGFVLVSVLTKNLMAIRNKYLISEMFVLLLFLFVAIIFSIIYTNALRKLFFGYRPEEFRELHLDQEEVFNSLEEGIVAINDKDEILLINKAAKILFNLDLNNNYYRVDFKKIYPDTALYKTIQTGIPEYNISLSINSNTIFGNRIPIKDNENILGAVGIFRDKTEVTDLAEKLTGANYMVDTLRAYNHDFMNKLHIILGLLEMDQIDNAKKYIEESAKVSSDVVSKINKIIPIKSLAALLIGKSIRANELGITINIKTDSYFKEKEAITSEDYVTIIGNLLENAIYELNKKENGIKEIELGIYSSNCHTLIVCEDNGGGIPDEILKNLYKQNITTKGEGHGSGLFIIKQTVDQYGGEINIDTKLGEGTCFEINFPM